MEIPRALTKLNSYKAPLIVQHANAAAEGSGPCIGCWRYECCFAHPLSSFIYRLSFFSGDLLVVLATSHRLSISPGGNTQTLIPFAVRLFHTGQLAPHVRSQGRPEMARVETRYEESEVGLGGSCAVGYLELVHSLLEPSTRSTRDRECSTYNGHSIDATGDNERDQEVSDTRRR